MVWKVVATISSSFKKIGNNDQQKDSSYLKQE